MRRTTTRAPGEAGPSPALTRNRRHPAEAGGEPECLERASGSCSPSRYAGRSPDGRLPRTLGQPLRTGRCHDTAHPEGSTMTGTTTTARPQRAVRAALAGALVLTPLVAAGAVLVPATAVDGPTTTERPPTRPPPGYVDRLLTAGGGHLESFGYPDYGLTARRRPRAGRRRRRAGRARSARSTFVRTTRALAYTDADGDPAESTTSPTPSPKPLFVAVVAGRGPHRLRQRRHRPGGPAAVADDRRGPVRGPELVRPVRQHDRPVASASSACSGPAPARPARGRLPARRSSARTAASRYPDRPGRHLHQPRRRHGVRRPGPVRGRRRRRRRRRGGPGPTWPPCRTTPPAASATVLAPRRTPTPPVWPARRSTPAAASRRPGSPRPTSSRCSTAATSPRPCAAASPTTRPPTTPRLAAGAAAVPERPGQPLDHPGRARPGADRRCSRSAPPAPHAVAPGARSCTTTSSSTTSSSTTPPPAAAPPRRPGRRPPPARPATTSASGAVRPPAARCSASDVEAAPVRAGALARTGSDVAPFCLRGARRSCSSVRCSWSPRRSPRGRHQ